MFVADHYELLRRQKVFSALVPAEFGGAGVSHGAMCDFLRRLAHYCPSTALALSMHQHLVAASVYHHRNGWPGAKLLERVAATQLVLVTSAPFEDPQQGWQVLHFAVPFSARGVSLADDWQSLGMRASGSCTVVLDEVYVPDDAISLRRPRGRFHPAWNVILTVAMPLIMSVYAGVAEAAAAIGRQLAAKRRDDPTVPFLLGELENRLANAQLAMDDMVRLANDLEFPISLDLTNAMLVRKTIVAESVLATVEKALEAAGGAGFYRKTGLERLLRDAHGAQFTRCRPSGSIILPAVSRLVSIPSGMPHSRRRRVATQTGSTGRGESGSR